MEYIIFGAAVILFLILYMIRCVLDEKRRKKEFKKKLYEDYGKISDKKYPEGRLATMAKRLEKLPETEGDCFRIDAITWNDLDMDRVFCRMDYTFSATGEEMLYRILRCPCTEEAELQKREQLIRYFMEQEDSRVALQMLYAQIGRTGKYSIYEYMDYLENLQERRNTKHYIVLAAMVAAIILCFFNLGYGLTALAVLLCYNLITYFKEKGEIDPYITTFAYVLRILKMESLFSGYKIGIIKEYVEDMDEKRRKFGKFARFSSLLTAQNSMSGNPLDIFVDYMRMGLHLNLIKFNTMLAECKKYKADIISIIETMGYIESMISIGAYRASMDEYCEPDFTMAEKKMEAKEIAHPLLEHPVCNSFAIEKGMLLTGSNASGKSTFLKTVAVAQIMAQSVHTVCAKEYKTTFYRMYTSMALRDDMESSESYFIVEIKALKRIIDAADADKVPVLCFVDEVLRGTNTVERIAAASQILEQTAQDGVFCFAATHDIELTTLLQKEYVNYHFEETISENDVKFNYLLKEGKATSRNAIKLLAVLGYEKGIITSAEERANRFLQCGEWK
ncbi:MAG: hypothetical protein IJ429_03715 [Lachnospiraceae bacterium]|nr:hypothetical protein [Lachnospiraceae bacterium]